MTRSTPHSSGRALYGVANVVSMTVFHAMLAPDRREALEIEDAIVGIGWRLAHEHAGRRLDCVFQRFVVARGDGGHLDAVAGQHAVDELARVPIAVVGDDDVSTAREQREERGRHGAGALERVAHQDASSFVFSTWRAIRMWK